MQETTHTIEGQLQYIKDSGRLKVFEVQTEIEGLSGSIYLDIAAPLFGKIILSKKATEEER